MNVLVDAADELAEIVTNLVRSHAARFPLLADTLRRNVALHDTTEYAWLPETGPKTKWGALQDVAWVADLTAHRSAATPLGDVRVSENLLGQQLDITTRGSERPAATLTLTSDADDAVAGALAAVVQGLVETGGKVRDIREILLPIAAQELVGGYARDTAALSEPVDNYRRQRQLIDDALADAL